MNDRVFEIVSALRGLTPASRRFRRFLRSLPVDPATLQHPIEAPDPRSFILCGSARTGTTLLSAMLLQPPRIVTVMEPWDGMRLAPADLFRSERSRLLAGVLNSGKLDADALLEAGEVRWIGEGASSRTVELDPEFLLGIKWPVFWRYLPYLPDTKFVVTLRHPYEVISSFRKEGGRLRMGLDYDTPFNLEMNRELSGGTKNLMLRRVRLFDYIHERILPYLQRPNVLAVRYERWFDEESSVQRELSDFLGVELEKGPARIRAVSRVKLSDEERALIRKECRTAAALGYNLDD